MQPNMEVEIKKTTSCRCEVSVVVPAAKVDAAFGKVLQRLSREVKMPGFRPGKVPRALVEKRFGDQIRSDVHGELVETTLFDVVQEKSIEMVGIVGVDAKTPPSRGATFAYTAQVDTRPEIEIKKTRGLAVAKVEASIEDEELEAELEKLRQNQATLVPVLDRAIAQEGDHVVMDYAGSIDGVPFAGGSAQNATVEVLGKGFLPDFSKGPLGAHVPGERTVPVAFPDDYNAKELAGKTAQFQMTFKELKKREIPALDDDLAADLGETNLDALKDKTRRDLLTTKRKSMEDEHRQAVLKALVEANPMEVPASMVARERENLLKNAQERMKMLFGRDLDLTSDDMASLRESSTANAEFIVKSGLLVSAVAKAEKLEVEDADLDAEFAAKSTEFGMPQEKVKALYGESDRADQLRWELLHRKVIAFVTKHAVHEAATKMPPPAAAKQGPDDAIDE